MYCYDQMLFFVFLVNVFVWFYLEVMEDSERVWYCGSCCGCGLKKIVL